MRGGGSPALMAGWLALTAATGCIDFHPLIHGNPESSVKESVEDFNTDLRWGRIDRAAQRVAPDRRADFVMMFRQNDSFHFTGVEIDGLDYDGEREHAVVRVRFTLFRPPAIREMTFHDSQQWSYDRGEAAWLVDPDLAAFERAGRP